MELYTSDEAAKRLVHWNKVSSELNYAISRASSLEEVGRLMDEVDAAWQAYREASRPGRILRTDGE